MVAVVAALPLLLPLLPTISAAVRNSFLRQNLSPDLGNNGFSDFNARRQGRYFYFGNGTAMINTTTVAIGATFASFIGLGLLSVYGQAVGEANARLAASAANATASKVGEQLDDLDYDAEYERQYAEYLRQYQVWAETYGQDPVPPASARSKR